MIFPQYTFSFISFCSSKYWIPLTSGIQLNANGINRNCRRNTVSIYCSELNNTSYEIKAATKKRGVVEREEIKSMGCKRFSEKLYSYNQGVQIIDQESLANRNNPTRSNANFRSDFIRSKYISSALCNLVIAWIAFINNLM